MPAWKHAPIGWIIPFLLAVCLLSVAAPAQYSGGRGTADDPYQIATAADLIALGETSADYDKHFILTADIDLDPNLPRGRVFEKALIGGSSTRAEPPTPIAEGYQGTPFTGVLDGNDHEIRNLVIRAPHGPSAYLAGVGAGLIAQIGGKGQVKHLVLRNIVVDADTRVGAVAGENRGTVVSCRSTGSVQGPSVGGLVGLNWGGIVSWSNSSCNVVKDKRRTDVVGFDYAGGLVGQNADGTIFSSCSSGDVAGDILTGGLAGDNSGTVYSCYSSSKVRGGSSAGGLVGRNGGGILSSYSTGDVSGAYSVGGLVGEDNVGSIVASYSTGRVTGNKYIGGLIGESLFTSVYFSYWIVETSGLKESAGGEGKTTQQMTRRETFAGWGHKAQWVLDDGKDYPHLTWEGHSGVPITDPAPYSGGTGEPNDPYQIRTAKDLASVGRFPSDWEASFALADDIDMAAIDPNKVLAIGTNGLPFAGAFDGRGHTVRNFNGSFMNGGFTGLFGWIGPSGTVHHLHLKDVVISQGNTGGGLAGWNEGTIRVCSTTGLVTAGDRVGGLVGVNRGTITSSCARCDVLERAPAWVGGLVAVNSGTISSCYAAGAVQGWCVGGLVGDNRDGTILTSYSIGVVKLHGPVNNGGGLVSCIGFDDGRATRERPARPPDEGYGVVTASFWDIQTSEWTEASGGTGLSTSAMQKAATFLNAGWDFVGETANGLEDIWWIDEGKDYPRLWWEAAKR